MMKILLAMFHREINQTIFEGHVTLCEGMEIIKLCCNSFLISQMYDI